MDGKKDYFQCFFNLSFSLRSNGVLHLSAHIIFGRLPPLTFPSAVGQTARTLGCACLPVCESNVVLKVIEVLYLAC